MDTGLHTYNTDSISVVIVEDEPELLEVYRRYLQDTFDVRTATNGNEALDIVDETVDVVLLDRDLPDVSGDEVLAEVRERGYDVPVAMVTAVDPDVDIVDLPFDEYLLKPIDQDLLVRTVAVLANRVSFEQKSREFFQLAAKKATLDAGGIDVSDDTKQYTQLINQMAEIQSELHATVKKLIEDTEGVVSRSSPDQRETQVLLTDIYDHQLPDSVRKLVDDYQELRDARPPFMWKWVHRLAPQNTLSCVDQEFTETVPVDKTIAILFITLLDDILEEHDDRATFNELAKIPDEQQQPDLSLDGVDTEYVAFAERVWETLLDRIGQAPKHDIYADLFRYDVKQAINAIEYSNLAIQRPDLATMNDLERYESHNMVLFAYADIDLMYSSANVRNELSTLREAIWTAQLMARIGNWVSTWERELREGDYSSGPVVYALEEGIIPRSKLVQADEDDEELMDEFVRDIKEHGIEKEFLVQWEQHYYSLWDYDNELSAIDFEPFIHGTREVLRYHLASTGLK
jgi:DNA-binding response OmpR family regulator